jgi:hypothetical protein
VREEDEAARVLSEIRTQTGDPRLAAMAGYALARLNYDRFRRDAALQHYHQAVRYAQESLQGDPNLTVAKRFLDYLLSFDESATVPKAGEGDARIQTESEAGAIAGRTPRF